MYRISTATPSEPESFELPFGGKLSDENRWVIMTNLIPWEKFEEEYAKSFSENKGAPALPFRIAMSALIIQERLGISDRETVEQIRENPYLQYFIGLTKYQIEAPFDASMMVYFRKRIKLNLLNKINQEMVKKVREILDGKESGDGAEERGEESEQPNSGKLILDATCAPADIKYPTDLDLLNQARQGTEKIRDCLYQEVKSKLNKKPRTSRKIARKNYLKVAKNVVPLKKKDGKPLVNNWDIFKET
jgi:hypothetical protein